MQAGEKEGIGVQIEVHQLCLRDAISEVKPIAEPQPRRLSKQEVTQWAVAHGHKPHIGSLAHGLCNGGQRQMQPFERDQAPGEQKSRCFAPLANRPRFDERSTNLMGHGGLAGQVLRQESRCVLRSAENSLGLGQCTLGGWVQFEGVEHCIAQHFLEPLFERQARNKTGGSTLAPPKRTDDETSADAAQPTGIAQ